MGDPRVEAVAKVLVEYSVDVHPGQLVRLRGNPEGSPLLLAVLSADPRARRPPVAYPGSRGDPGALPEVRRGGTA